MYTSIPNFSQHWRKMMLIIVWFVNVYGENFILYELYLSYLYFHVYVSDEILRIGHKFGICNLTNLVFFFRLDAFRCVRGPYWKNISYLGNS